MKRMQRTKAFFLMTALVLTSVVQTATQEQVQNIDSARVIILHEKVGDVVDLAERNYYSFQLLTQNLISAVFLEFPDGSLAMQITGNTVDGPKTKTVPITREKFEYMRKQVKEKSLIELKEQAKILAQEKWTKERWNDEILNDKGLTYRAAGGALGFTLGAAAGMLIGKGLQGRKVERTEYSDGGEWGDPWSEDFYSYENKYAPHWGAVIGGISGGVAGSLFGKKADKEFYIFVPKDIRMQYLRPSGFFEALFIGGTVGAGMGWLTGWALHTPMSQRSDEGSIGIGVLPGFVIGAINGSMIHSGFKGRYMRKQRWEKIYMEKEYRSSIGIRFFPVNHSGLRIYAQKLPSGEAFYEYRMDMLQVRF